MDLTRSLGAETVRGVSRDCSRPPVELVLLIAFFAEWYRSAGRRLSVGERRALPGPG
ncbi:hypothetical protein [Labedella populi]|uniref:hypothetical protein n=1 Tax=Labedella populi TaxID=2498850 RepID=UPI00140AF5EB|nr:hypothetical protein [Labedella populi]